MLESVMSYVLLVCGVLILGGSLYYLVQESHDADSRRIYGGASIVGVVILAVVFLGLV